MKFKKASRVIGPSIMALLFAITLAGLGMTYWTNPVLGRVGDRSVPLMGEESQTSVGEAVVKFYDGTTAEEIEAIHDKIGAEVVGTVQEPNIQWIKAQGRSDAELIKAYEKRPEVEFAKKAPNRMGSF